MRFAYSVPWWALAALAAAALGVALLAYGRARGTLGPARHAALVGLRTLALLLLIGFLLRPVVPTVVDDTEAAVAIVIDTSRSMALRDDQERARMARAVRLAADRLVPALSPTFKVRLFAGDRSVALENLSGLTASGPRTDLRGTLRSVQHAFPEGGLAGIVLISDGAETTHRDEELERTRGGPPVIAIGVGAPDAFDREIRSVTAGPSVIDGSLIDLAVTAVGHADGTRGLRVRLLQNGRVLDLKELAPAADGAPVQHVFTVAPEGKAASLFRVEVEGDERELTLDNNRLDVLVSPPGRRRRILMLEGAPGHEHTFLKRAWLQDGSLEVDSVVRKGTNDRGEDTFYVQAAGARTGALSGGFPATLEALFQYDSVVLANLDLQTLSRAHAEWLAEFVGERGGGLLAFGGPTLAGPGLAGSSLERVMPVDLTDRRGDPVRAAAVDVERLKVALTDEGRRHPVMRLAQSDGDTLKRWAALPALAGVEAVGAPRSGGTVLAWTSSSGGRPVPLLAVQRFGRGRSMVFAGEASWRWKMLSPASDRSFDTFWRQAIRWLSIQSPDPVALTAPAGVPVGDAVPVTVHVRDAAFRPARTPALEAAVTAPDGTSTPVSVLAEDPREGRYTVVVAASQPGIYRVNVTASQGRQALGSAEQLILAGGFDPEFADPRLNEPVLRRLAESSGGRYVREADETDAASWLRDTARARREELRDVWHGAWSFLAIVGLLSVEWTLRRQWGLK